MVFVYNLYLQRLLQQGSLRSNTAVTWIQRSTWNGKFKFCFLELSGGFKNIYLCLVGSAKVKPPEAEEMQLVGLSELKNSTHRACAGTFTSQRRVTSHSGTASSVLGSLSIVSYLISQQLCRSVVLMVFLCTGKQFDQRCL